MAQNKTSKRKNILDQLKSEERKQQLFMLPTDLLERFKSDCKKEGVPMSRVLEALIRDYLGEKNGK